MVEFTEKDKKALKKHEKSMVPVRKKLERDIFSWKKKQARKKFASKKKKAREEFAGDKSFNRDVFALQKRINRTGESLKRIEKEIKGSLLPKVEGVSKSTKALKPLGPIIGGMAGPVNGKKKKQGKAIGGPIENPLDKKQNPLYREELGMYGGGAVRKKMYARGGGTRPTRG